MLVSCVCSVKLLYTCWTSSTLLLCTPCPLSSLQPELRELQELRSCFSNLAGRKFTNWFVIPLQFATIMITLATCGILGGQALQVTHSALLNA